MDTRIEDATGPVGPRGRTPVSLGKRFKYVIAITAPPGARVYVPANPALGPVRVLDVKREVQAATDGKPGSERHIYTLIPVRIGPERVGAMEIPYELSGGKAGVVKVKGLKLRVRGRLENDQDPALGAQPKPAQVTTENWLLITLLGTLLVMLFSAVLTLVVLRILRDRLVAALPKPPPPPPNLLAYGRLGQLAGAEIPATEKLAEVTDVLREYLGGRYGFDGLEMTTVEMMRELADVDLKEISPHEIRVFLDDADLVKFAKSSPTDAEAEARIPTVRRVVDVTWEEPEVEVVDVPQFEPASNVERLKAGLIDCIFFFVPSAALTTTLLIGGHVTWAWLGGVMMGLLFLTRDLIGAGSPGKRLFGLRVVNVNEAHQTLSLGQRLGRNVILAFAPIGLPIEGLVLGYSPFDERLGDRWSGTGVVRPTVLRGNKG